jgi:HAMP domain-containing protein
MTKHQTQAEPAAPAEPVTPAEVQPPEDPATRIAELEAALQEMKDKWLRS